MIQNKTKFEDTKEHFISEGLLNICKSQILSLNITVHLQNPAVQKQPLPLSMAFSNVFKGLLIYMQQILGNKILSKKSR